MSADKIPSKSSYFQLDGFKPSSLICGMAKKETAILEVLFPRVRAELLRALFGTPSKERYVRELMALTGLAMHTIQDELRKLSAIGVVVSWSSGYHRFFGANGGHPLAAHLRSIVELSETLPRAKHAALRRPPARAPGVKRPKRRVRSIPPSRPPSWGIFEAKKTA